MRSPHFAPTLVTKAQAASLASWNNGLKAFLDNNPVHLVLALAGKLPQEQMNIAELEAFLKQNIDQLSSGQSTNYCKLICILDFLKYSPASLVSQPAKISRRRTKLSSVGDIE